MTYPNEVLDLLREIVAAGGSLEVIEGSFNVAEGLGLVDVNLSGGGWGYHEIATLTNEGRRALGLAVVTPAQRITLLSRFRRMIGIIRLT